MEARLKALFADRALSIQKSKRLHWRSAHRLALLLLVLAGAASPACADVVWPALVLQTRLLSLWSIPAGLAAEYVFLKGPMRLTRLRAISLDITMNGVSALCGLFMIPAAGLVWEWFPGHLINRALHVGTFNGITWGATFVIVVVINTCIESLVITRAFKLSMARSNLGLLCLANAVSVGFAFTGMIADPPVL